MELKIREKNEMAGIVRDGKGGRKTLKNNSLQFFSFSLFSDRRAGPANLFLFPDADDLGEDGPQERFPGQNVKPAYQFIWQQAGPFPDPRK